MKVLIAGDFCPKARGQKIVDNKEYIGKFDDIIRITSQSDFAFVNFETNVSSPDSTPIEKHGPSLTTTSGAVEMVKYLGFNVVTLANNHFFDFGSTAVNNTIEILKEHEIAYVGGGKTLEEAQEIKYFKRDGKTLAVINACEYEFSIANEIHGGSNHLDPVFLYYSILEAKQNADFVLCITHGGHERYQLPSIRMQDWYRFFIDAGADAVINHHQHCFSGMEIYNGKPIYYGLGNFFFDSFNPKEKAIWNEGFMVELNFGKDITHSIIPYIQCKESASIYLLNDKQAFQERFDILNEIIQDRKKLKECNESFYRNCTREVLGAFQPYRSRILCSAYARGLFPSAFNRKKILAISNMVLCEAHQDKLKSIFH